MSTESDNLQNDLTLKFGTSISTEVQEALDEKISTITTATTTDLTGVIVGNGSTVGSLGYTPADDAAVVHLAGTETVSGLKKFTSGIWSGIVRALTGGIVDIQKEDGTSLIRVGVDYTGTGGSSTGVEEGSGTTASGNYSHAEGDATTASGHASHAEGSGTTSSGNASHAEGGSSIASGDFSHAEGALSEASGDYSHVEGFSSFASGDYSHAGGRESNSDGNNSRAIGRRAKAVHDGASVESDSQDADVSSTTTDQKTFRFANGYRFMGGDAVFDGEVLAATLSGVNTGDQDLSGYQTKAGTLALAGFSSITGTLPAANVATLNQSTTGSAATLTTGRTLAITGDLTWTSPSFNGSGNVTAAGTLATVNANVGTFGSATTSLTATVNAKGLVTALSSQTVTPAVGSITGLGTGVATALAVNVGSAGAFVTINGALGTPTSGTLTNCTGLTVAGGGTGRATSTTAYGLLAAGTTATGAHQTLSAGATTTMLVGGGSSALPVWTTATGTGSPVRATSPTITAPILKGSGISTGASVAVQNSASTTSFTVRDDGRVSVGNVTPNATFDVGNYFSAQTGNAISGQAAYVVCGPYSSTLGGDAAAQFNITSNSSTGYALFRFGIISPGTGAVGEFGSGGSSAGLFSNTVFFNTKGSSPLVFAINNAESSRISASGGVSVGTATDAGATNLLVAGTIKAGATVRLKGYTVATLPAGTVGDTAYVSDALAPTFLTTVVGGGAITTTVFYNGTNWVSQ